MATYKLSLLGLFLIILGALVISILAGNWFQTSYSRKEGMVSYNFGKSPLTKVYIPEYSGPETGSHGKNVYLVYDNLYFDTDNGNLIEVGSPQYIGGNTVVGNTVVGNNAIHTLHISNSLKTINTSESIDLADIKRYDISGALPTIDESKNTFRNSYTEYLYFTRDDNVDPVYVVVVLPWKDSTYMHILDLGFKESLINGKISPRNIATVWFGPNKQSAIQQYSNSVIELDQNPPSGYQPRNNGPWINSYGIIETYDKGKMVYILSDDVSYDDKNGLLIITEIENNNPKIRIFKQDGIQVALRDVPEHKLMNIPFKTWIIYNNMRNTMVTFITNGENVMITVITNTGFMNIQRFNRFGVDSGPTDGQPGSSNFLPSKSPPPINNNPSNNNNNSANNNNYNNNNNSANNNSPPNMMNDYYQWFYYWATQGLNNNPNSPNFNYSDDYIMKTQIVPPVCPSCPSCPASGTCNNCGGHGGCGTQTTSGNTMASGNNSYLDSAVNTGKSMIGNAQDKATGVISGSQDNIGKLATGVRDEARLIAGSTVNIAKDTVSGTVNLGKDIVGGTVGLGKDIVGGTIGLGREVLGGIAGLGQNPNQGQGQGQGMDRTGYSNSYGGPNALLPQNQASNVDRSNLYGAMPNKGRSDFMPISSDFSKFGR